jgi:hypothetical protein
MKTTLDLNDDLLAQAKAQAALERTSLTRLIEDGLTLRLRNAPAARPIQVPVIPMFGGGGAILPGIDPCSNRSLLDACDDDA